MLATLWWPSTNPIGPASLWPLGIVTLVAVIACLSKRSVITHAAPAVFAVLAVLSAGFPFAGRRFPNADDFVGYYIWSLAACCFALEAARSASLRSLIYGSAVIFPMGWLLVLEIAARSLEFILKSRDVSVLTIALLSLLLWSVLYTALVYRAAQPYLRALRIGRGLCGRRGYDMRASPQQCPECGEPGVQNPATPKT